MAMSVDAKNEWQCVAYETPDFYYVSFWILKVWIEKKKLSNECME